MGLFRFVLCFTVSVGLVEGLLLDLLIVKFYVYECFARACGGGQAHSALMPGACGGHNRH